ncbi:MAG: hypothetical protein WBE03_00435, partial [Terracidiphilus sp.]
AFPAFTSAYSYRSASVGLAEAVRRAASMQAVRAQTANNTLAPGGERDPDAGLSIQAFSDKYFQCALRQIDDVRHLLS